MSKTPYEINLGQAKRIYKKLFVDDYEGLAGPLVYQSTGATKLEVLNAIVEELSK